MYCRYINSLYVIIYSQWNKLTSILSIRSFTWYQSQRISTMRRRKTIVREGRGQLIRTRERSSGNRMNLWHSRLGRLSGPKLRDIAALDHHVTDDHVLPCDYCHFSKQKKLVFPVSTSVSTCVLIWFTLIFGVSCQFLAILIIAIS